MQFIRYRFLTMRQLYSEMEFWAGKPSRLHDRVRYTRTGDEGSTADPESGWKIERLAP